MSAFQSTSAFEEIELAEAAEWFARALLYPSLQTPVGAAPTAVLHVLQNADQLQRDRDPVVYCGLFDVGKPEPAAPLQESFYHGDPHARLRRLVNFYRHYDIAQQTQWAPDHLCVELQFLGYLLRLVAAYPERDDVKLAARTFARLHIGSFVYQCQQRVQAADQGGVFAALLAGVIGLIALLGAESRIAVNQASHRTLSRNEVFTSEVFSSDDFSADAMNSIMSDKNEGDRTHVE